ncbi:MAG: hypothetical protein LBE92_10830 [Chryseobacterium sp.]|jgi:hypothetical protein|uniref:hypothetical protein n=1 Tax=Chryseobacterium sp. TaxID=1871047 RepID=UPI00281B9069|nr:hypothetical protein [Chryseobacterium sp.]MDR2236610.1 hypothetical protein [Chryseobacterium sp.]
MKISLAIFAFTCILSLSSCTSDEESKRQVNSAFQGQYKGTFSGDENGTITFTVSKEGTMDGELTSAANSKETIGGYVNFDGKFDMNTKNNFQLTGYLKHDKTAGVWSRNSLSGTYTFDKK